MCAPRASASTSSGCAYSRSIRSRTRRSRARSRRCCASAGLLVTLNRATTGRRRQAPMVPPLRIRSTHRPWEGRGRQWPQRTPRGGAPCRRPRPRRAGRGQVSRPSYPVSCRPTDTRSASCCHDRTLTWSLVRRAAPRVSAWPRRGSLSRRPSANRRGRPRARRGPVPLPLEGVHTRRDRRPSHARSARSSRGTDVRGRACCTERSRLLARRRCPCHIGRLPVPSA